MRSMRRGWVGAIVLGGLVFACGEDLLPKSDDVDGGGPDAARADASDVEDASTSDATRDATLDAPLGDASDDGGVDGSPSLDASVDAALPPINALAGVWEGNGFDFAGWTILYAITPNDGGLSFGVASYPSLGCGGSLKWLGEDAGIDGGPGDAGSRLILREQIGGTGVFCLNDVDMVLELVSADTISARFLEVGTHAQLATGTLRRLSSAVAGDDRRGVWRDPADAGSNYHPILAAISRTDQPSPAGGVYLVPSTPGKACSGIWETTGVDAGDIYVRERSPDGGPACSAFGDALLRRTNDGKLTYGPTDGGTAGLRTLEKR